MQSDNTTLMLIRHGETVWNREGRFQGHGDSPLTEAGRAQAQAVGQRLQHMHFDALISSDLGRACETAAIVAQHIGTATQTDARLRERHYGVLEGLTFQEITQRHGDVYARLITEDPDFTIPGGGQNHRQHYADNIDFFAEWLRLRAGTTAAVVVHSGVLDNVFRFVTGLALDHPRCVLPANASLSVIAHGHFYGSRRWIIRSWAETAHLRDLPSSRSNAD